MPTSVSVGRTHFSCLSSKRYNVVNGNVRFSLHNLSQLHKILISPCPRQFYLTSSLSQLLRKMCGSAKRDWREAFWNRDAWELQFVLYFALKASIKKHFILRQTTYQAWKYKASVFALSEVLHLLLLLISMLFSQRTYIRLCQHLTELLLFHLGYNLPPPSHICISPVLPL